MSSSCNRFHAKNRLLTAADFQKVFGQAVRSGDRLFTVLATANQVNVARLGLAISKKSARRAVDRNKLKRISRESFRKHQQQLAGMDVIVMARPGAANKDNPALFKSLDGHWKTLSDKIQSAAV